MADPEGFVLAGGRSSRFGEDKAAFPVDGVPCAVRVALALAPLCPVVRVVRRAEQPARAWLAPSGVAFPELRGEEGQDVHPLWGVAAALAACADRAVIAPCDLPALSTDAVQALLEAGGPAIATDGTREHFLLLVAPATEAQRARELARAGSSVAAFVAGWRRVRVDEAAVRNMNRRA